MRNALDPRHQKRQKLLEELFKITFAKQRISNEAKLIVEQQKILDQKIQNVAPQFPLDKINKVDLAILRLAVYELLVGKKEPPKVVIDEAIELAKEYGNESSPGFINGALGKLIKNDSKVGKKQHNPLVVD